MTGLTIALSKGRILEETIPLLQAAGIEPVEDIFSSRKLIFDTNQENVRLVVIRATDVPTYVAHGAADLGVAGKDVLLESGVNDLYEPLDLAIAKCKLMTAGRVGDPEPKGRIRVATKFVELTKKFYADRGQQVDIIKLYGAMELAPILGLADRIVDIVDTGRTLKANGLESLELIMPVSAHMVVCKASMKLKHDLIQPLLNKLAQAVAARGAAA